MNQQSHIVYSRRLTLEADPCSVLSELLDKIGGLRGRINKGDIVLIKPNFVAPFPNATTDLRFIDFFIERIRDAGGVPVVGEASGYEFGSEVTFDILGVRSFLAARDIELVNFENAKYISVDIGSGLAPVEIAESAMQAKLIINLPVLKGHTITRITASAKNLFGFLSKPSRRYLHFNHLEEAIASLAKRFDNAIHFVDARLLLTRAVFGQSQPLGYCLAGTDPFALDHFGSRLLGIDPSAVKHLAGTTDEYTVDGAVPEILPPLKRKDSLKDRLHRWIYSGFYRTDHIKCSLFGGKSIIPHLHWYLGVHPQIGRVTDDQMEELASICPVGAIDAKRCKIIKKKCIKVRCLKCYRESEPGRIILKGFGRPKGRA